jgi:hypothetical protein
MPATEEQTEEHPIIFRGWSVRRILADEKLDPSSYILGIVHGDGHVSKRSVCVSVGYQDKEYARKVTSLFYAIGVAPSVYKKQGSLSIEIHNKQVADRYRELKGQSWILPDYIKPLSYLSGLIDTDGWVSTPPKARCTVVQKDLGNLETVAKLLKRQTDLIFTLRHITRKIDGEPYEVESMKFDGFDKVYTLSESVCLLHPDKRSRLACLRDHISQKRKETPRWEEVGRLIFESPHTRSEISSILGVTSREAGSSLTYLRRKGWLVTHRNHDPFKYSLDTKPWK